MQSLTGQYECNHRSALGLDYFTARLDRLTLYATGRFALFTQEKSRVMHAVKHLAAGEQASMEAPETRAEGNYRSQGTLLFLTFDDGTQDQGTIQDTGLLFGKDFFEKVASSTFMPPAQRVQSNMEDIAKGLKIAGAIGGTVLKAAKTIQGTIQSTSPAPNQAANAQNFTPAPSAGPVQSTVANPQPQAGTNASDDTFFCDQCGAPVRSGKNFCNKCGARLA